VSHGDGHSSEGLDAFGQGIDNLGLFAEVLVEEKMELIKRGTRDLPMMLLVHVPQGHGIGENLIQAAGVGQPNLVIERQGPVCHRPVFLDFRISPVHGDLFR
jgi:hypothetical protein